MGNCICNYNVSKTDEITTSTIKYKYENEFTKEELHMPTDEDCFEEIENRLDTFPKIKRTKQIFKDKKKEFCKSLTTNGTHLGSNQLEKSNSDDYVFETYQNYRKDSQSPSKTRKFITLK